MNQVEELARRFGAHISTPWQRDLAGQQKTLIVVYRPDQERRLRGLIGLFEEKTLESGHGWKIYDCTQVFSQWMSGLDYHETYFEEPDALPMVVKDGFRPFLVDDLKNKLQSPEADENAVVAIIGTACLFGFISVSEMLRDIAPAIRGRLAVFFPGSYENHVYRFLDARDGWNYQAVPITLTNGMFDL